MEPLHPETDVVEAPPTEPTDAPPATLAEVADKPRWHPNRVAVYLTAGGGLATALAVPLADLDTTSVAGIIAGLAAIATVVREWLVGWREHEARQAGE